MLFTHDCDAAVVECEVECEEEDDQWGDDLGDEEDTGVIGGVIAVEDDLADVAYGISEEPYGVGDGGGQPEVSTEPETENSEDPDGEIGHADFIFVRAGRPADGCRCLERTKDVGIGRQESHETDVEEEQIKQTGSGDRRLAASAAG
jgi:hypothetical protein